MFNITGKFKKRFQINPTKDPKKLTKVAEMYTFLSRLLLSDSPNNIPEKYLTVEFMVCFKLSYLNIKKAFSSTLLATTYMIN